MQQEFVSHAIEPVRGRIMRPLAAILLVLVGVFGWMIIRSEQQAIEQANQRVLLAAAAEFPESLNKQYRLLSSIATLLTYDPELAQALRRRDRQALVAAYTDVYAQLRSEQRITHFYLHNADRTNLVRLHQPWIYGDRVARITAREAERTRSPAAGLELGYAGALNLRVVHPVFVGESLLGYVELGKELGEVLGEIRAEYRIEFALTVSKDVITKGQWRAGMNLLRRKGEWDFMPNDALIYSSVIDLPETWRSALVQRPPDQLHTLVVTGGNGETWRTMASPIIDAAGAQIGALHLFLDISDEVARFERKLALDAALAFSLAAVVLGFLFLVLRRVDHDILAQHKALAQNEKRLSLLLNTLPHGVEEHDVNGVITFSNLAHQRILGRDANEVVGRTIWELDTDAPDLRQAQIRLSHLVDHQPAPEPYITHLSTPDDRQVVLEVNWDYQRDAEGKVTGFISVVSDITARAMAEEALKASEERFRNLVESSQDWVWEVNCDGLYAYASPRCRELLGYEPEELVGRSPFELMPPDEADRVERAFVQSVASGQAISALQNVNLHKDGHQVVLETSGVPFYDARQKLLGYRGMDRDVTARVQAERAQRESEARYRAVFNQQFQLMAILAPDGTTLDINEFPLRMQGSDRADYIGKPFWRSPAWAGLSEWHEIWQRRLTDAATTDGPILTDDIYQTADGKIRHADAATQAIRDAAGELLFFLIQATDTTDRKRSEAERDQLLQDIQQLNEELEQRVRHRTAELEAVNQELASFAYSVSHDLRAPLRAIDGFSLALVEDYAAQLDDRALDYLQRVRSGAQRMGLLIDDLLELSRLNRSEFRIETVDLSEIARGVLDELIAGEPERKLKMRFGPDLRLQGDARLLRVLVANLLGNAWKFSAHEPVSRITFDRLRDTPAVLYIRDNGVGFDMRYYDKLFGAFQRLHTNHEFPGTGIGLATVQRIVHRHGGRVWAESKKGEGATFYFSLAPETAPAGKQTGRQGEA